MTKAIHILYLISKNFKIRYLKIKRKNYFGVFSRYGFTLTETLVVVVALSITVGYLFPSFLSNWSAYEKRIAEANLWHEATTVIDSMTEECRRAWQVDVLGGDGQQRVVFYDAENQPRTTYYFDSNGTARVQRHEQFLETTLSTHLRFDRVHLLKDGSKALIVHLVLEDHWMGDAVYIETETEIYPRN
jgi:prepilin-type N-terminal cleavage/methylation domain-containing protein